MLPKKFRYSILLMFSVIGLIGLVLSSYRLGLQAGAKNRGSSDLIDPKVVTVAELATIAADRSIFYQGSNRDFHYLRIEDAGYFRIRCSEATIPQNGFDGDGSSGLGYIWSILAIENGKLKSPASAPSEITGIF